MAPTNRQDLDRLTTCTRRTRKTGKVTTYTRRIGKGWTRLSGRYLVGQTFDTKSAYFQDPEGWIQDIKDLDVPPNGTVSGLRYVDDTVQENLTMSLLSKDDAPFEEFLASGKVYTTLMKKAEPWLTIPMGVVEYYVIDLAEYNTMYSFIYKTLADRRTDLELCSVDNFKTRLQRLYERK